VNTRFYLEQFSEHKKRGLAAVRAGKPGQGRYHLLKAAEYLYRLAEKSSGTLRETRKTNAKQLIEMAKKLKGARAGGKYKGIEVAAGSHPLDTREGKEEPSRWLVVDRPQVKFSDVAGLEEAKRAVMRMVIYPFKHPETASRFRKRAGGGVLLYGPPGTGKTLFASAIAGELQVAAFFSARCSDIMSKWVGEAEQNIAELFAQARSYRTAVIFMDEVEAIIGKRDTTSTVMKRVIPEFLQQWQGLKDEKVPLLLLGATNRPWDLDDASLRPGRFDRLIYVDLPDAEARLQILESNLTGVPMAGVDLRGLASGLEGYSGADVVAICLRAIDAAFERQIATRQDTEVMMTDLLSAAHEVKPSVTEKMLARFRNFKEGRGLS
jgi:SpoVK/Ycf46/Vps4 family AAA+-type ATPase